MYSVNVLMLKIISLLYQHVMIVSEVSSLKYPLFFLLTGPCLVNRRKSGPVGTLRQGWRRIIMCLTLISGDRCVRGAWDLLKRPQRSRRQLAALFQPTPGRGQTNLPAWVSEHAIRLNIAPGLDKGLVEEEGTPLKTRTKTIWGFLRFFFLIWFPIPTH